MRKVSLGKIVQGKAEKLFKNAWLSVRGLSVRGRRSMEASDPRENAGPCRVARGMNKRPGNVPVCKLDIEINLQGRCWNVLVR